MENEGSLWNETGLWHVEADGASACVGPTCLRYDAEDVRKGGCRQTAWCGRWGQEDDGNNSKKHLKNKTQNLEHEHAFDEIVPEPTQYNRFVQIHQPNSGRLFSVSVVQKKKKKGKSSWQPWVVCGAIGRRLAIIGDWWSELIGGKLAVFEQTAYAQKRCTRKRRLGNGNWRGTVEREGVARTRDRPH